MCRSPAERPCAHRWQRHLEKVGGAECVVRVCWRCGRKELAWSRHGKLSRREAAMAGISGRPDAGRADN